MTARGTYETIFTLASYIRQAAVEQDNDAIWSRCDELWDVINQLGERQ